jgi:hypothetical protein
MHLTLRLLPIGLLALLASCESQQNAPSPSYDVVTDIHHTMELIVDPAADLIWSSAGSIITDTGEQDLAPTTVEGWFKVEAAAATLAEAGNLLMMPGRSAGLDWNKHSRDLISAGKLAIAAAKRQDADALFNAGGQIYQACLACHEQYWQDTSPPEDTAR